MKLSCFIFLLIISTITLSRTEETKSDQIVRRHIHTRPFFHGIHRSHFRALRPHSHSRVHAHVVRSNLIHHTHPTRVIQNNSLHLLNSFAKKYVTLANLAYCPKQKILSKTCKICPSILKSYKTFFIHSINENKKRIFQFVILYCDKKKEVIITFSGPKISQTKFFNKVYKRGFKKIAALNNVNIEKFYWEIYSKYIRNVLFKKITKIIKSKRGEYKFIFIGHSFGGSIATLSAYDLIQSKIIKSNKQKASPIVYTYGLMRIGDNNFVSKVNSLFKVVRIVRSNDYVTRAPSCVYDRSTRLFRCFRRAAKVIKHFPVYRRYFITYRRGLSVYRKSIVRRVTQRNTTQRGHIHSHYHAYYSQPLGTLIYYSGNNFSNYQLCKYVAGIPICEKKIRLPKSFSPSVHALYYGINVEKC